MTLQLFSKPEDVGRLDLARECLKRSMRWDEENFGREYDLDVLNVVCIDNFGGQMANKGLLIFDCDNLLADLEIGTGRLLLLLRVLVSVLAVVVGVAFRGVQQKNLASSLVFADAELHKVMSSVSHEYFRNWTGGRISVR